RWSVRRVFRTSYLAAGALGIGGVLGGLFVYALTRNSVFHGIRADQAVLALSSLPPVLAYQFADAILLARERYEGYAALEVSHSSVLLVVGAGLAIPFGLTGAVIGLPAAAVVGAATGAVLLTQEARRDKSVDSGDALSRAIPFGLQSWGANLFQQV